MSTKGVIRWDMLSTFESRNAIEMANKLAIDSFDENIWRESEMLIISDQLIALEDGDPNAFPVTESEWREYRTKVRYWKAGNSDFPNKKFRPTRPW